MLNPDLVIPPLAILVTGAIVYIALFFRNKAQQLRHAERMAAVEKGVDIPSEPTLGRIAYLLRGLIWLFVGVGIALFFLVMRSATDTRELGGVASLGVIPAGVGIAYLIVYRVQGRQEPPHAA